TQFDDAAIDEVGSPRSVERRRRALRSGRRLDQPPPTTGCRVPGGGEPGPQETVEGEACTVERRPAAGGMRPIGRTSGGTTTVAIAAARSDALSSALGELVGSTERPHQSLAAAVSHSERYGPSSSSTSSVHPRRGDSPPCLRDSAADRRGSAGPSPTDSALAGFPRPPCCAAPPGFAAQIDCSTGQEGRVAP